MQSVGLSLKSGRATAAKAIQARKQVEQMEIKNISMKPQGINISRYMPAAEPAEPEIPFEEDSYSDPIEEILNVITSAEADLRDNRKKIEAIKARREELAQEYRHLGISLGSALLDLTKKFEAVLQDPHTDVLISKPFTNGGEETI